MDIVKVVMEFHKHKVGLDSNNGMVMAFKVAMACTASNHGGVWLWVMVTMEGCGCGWRLNDMLF